MKRFYKFLMPLVAIVALALPWNARAQVTVTIGDGGTTTNSYLPMYTLYNNTLSEQIYTPTEVTMPGIITSIAFYNGGSEKSPNVKIYMINTTRTDFSSTTDWLPVTASDLVFQGNVTFTANQWTTITLDNPFTYDGSSNLGLIFDGNLNWSSGLACRVFSSTSNCAMYVYSDGTDYNAVGATYSANNRLSVKNQIQLGILPADMDCYPVRHITASNIGPWSCTLSWSDTNNAGASYVVISLPDSTVLASGISDTTVDLTNLLSDHNYTFGVYADCGGDGESMIVNTNVHTLVSCPNPTQVVVDSVGTDMIALHWTPGFEEAEWAIYVGDSLIDGITDTSYIITDLTLNTLYNIGVIAVCGAEDSSIASVTTVRTLAGDPISTFPYFCGFETAAENADWVLDNGTQANYWMVGPATASDGAQSLYITNNGAANAYNTSSISHVWAYATFSFADSGEYAFSYDWKCQGESRSYDWLRVFLAPASADFAAGSPQPFGTSTYAACSALAPNGWIDLSNRTTSPYTLAQTNTWTNETGTFVVGPGTYKLVFLWSNDGGGGTQPPAAVDNIQIVHNTCPQVQNLTASYVSTDSITVSWTAGGSETEWEIQIGNETPVTVNTTTYTFDELYSNTPYTIYVRAICTADDTSMVSTLNVRTACGPMVLPYSEDFESYTSGTVVPCWNFVMTGSNTGSNYYPVAYSSTTSYQHHSGTTGLRLYGLSYTCLPVIPEDVDMNQLSMGFWSDRSSTSYGLIVGVMSNPDSIATFDTIQVINYPSTNTQYYFEIDFSNYTGTGRYIAFRNYYTSGSTSYSYHYMDDISVWRNSTCATPTYVNVTGISNNVATVNWGEVDTANYDNVVVYWSTVNNITSADSVIVNGATNFTINGLTGSTTYYVWVKGNCFDEPSRAISTSFTTTPDCVPVQNLTVAGVDYHAFGLNWEAPEAGNPATEYIVSWKYNTATTWQSDTVTTTYYYINGLGLDSLYQYSVTTVCDTITSTANSGTVRTLGCGNPVTNGGATNNYLPLYQFYGYSYTQQIYLASELNGVDTISTLSFYTDGDVTGRPVVLYLGNTSKTAFSGTGDYVPASALTQVASTTFSGTGWMTFTLTTPFVRSADSNLVVAVDDNTGSYTSSVPWAATSTSTARGLYFYQDGTNINPSSPSASNSNTVNYVNQILIAGPTCDVPECGRPIIFANNITTNSVDVTWNTEAGLSYEVAYQQVGDSAWTVVDAGNTSGAASITGLTPAADWVIRVSTDCNGTALVGTASIATLCGPVALPYTEDFQNCEYGIYSRTCWYVGTTNLGTSNPYPQVVSLQGDSENKLPLIYNGGYLIMPEVDADLDQLQIRFTLLQGGDNVRFLMGLMPNDELPISAMIVLDTLIRSNIDSSVSAVNITYQFAGLDTAYNHYRIAFWDAFNDNYTFLDNIVVEYVPLCSPVATLAATTTTTTADITWDVEGTNATSHYIEYGPRNFVPGTGTTVAAPISPATITGLTPGTSYDAYVYTICGASSDTSIASQVIMFTTECDAIATLPYSTDFENIMSAGSTATNVQPNCWAAEASGTQPHIMYSTSTDYAPSQTHCYYFYDLGVAAMPQMAMPLDSLMVSFHVYNPTPGTYGLVIGAVDSIGPGFSATFQPIDTIQFENGVYSYNVTSFLTDYTGTANRIAMRNYNTSGNNSYATIYVDDLTIDYIPSCIAPQRVRTTALTNVSADIAWTISQAPSYSVEYGVHGFTPGTGTTLTVTNRNVSLTGLTPFTQYDVRIVGLCSATETSDTTVFTFTTLRAAPVTTFPYICDFADSTEANAWEPVSGTQNNIWVLGTTAHYGTADSMGYYVSNDGGTSNAYAGSASHSYVYRTFTFDAGSYNIAFKWQSNGEGSSSYAYDYMRAYLVPAGSTVTAGQAPDGGTSSYSNAFASPQAGWIALGGNSPLLGQTTWQSFSDDVTIPTAGNYNLVLYWGNDGSVYNNPAGAFDNVEIYRNTCPAPANIYSVAAGTSSITVDWDDLDTTFVAWNLEYGPAGFFQGTGTTMNVTSHPVTITGLQSLTNYDFYVQPICSGADTGRWSNPATLSTAMCDNATMAVNYTSSMTATEDEYSPIGYSYYNYSYVQTIIDSAYMSTLGGDVSAFGFNVTETESGSSYFTNMKVYMANVPESNLNSGWIVPDSNHAFVMVIDSGNFNHTTTGTHIFEFDTTFTWDGHSNVLFAVKRDHGSYASSGSFAAHDASANKMRYDYNDDDPYPVNNPNSVDEGTASSVTGDIILYSCGSACHTPAIDSIFVGETSAVVTWTGTASAYEVAVVEGSWNEPTSGTLVTGLTHTVTGLTPGMQYAIGVRAVCDEGNYSEWYVASITTVEHPCLAPTAVNVTGVTINGATVGWTAAEADQTNFQIRYSAAADTTVVDVTTNPYTLTGLLPNTEYSVSVRAVCGEGFYSDWTVAQPFTTASCQPVTGVTVTELTQTTAKVSWTAGSNSNGNYEVAYGIIGTSVQNATRQTVEGSTSYTITGLEEGTGYVVYVRSICAEGVQSDWTSGTTFTTEDEIGIADVDDSRISLYPNPASSTVTLTGIEGAATVTVVDMNGREVYSGNTADGRLTIDVSTLAQGAYFVRITGEQVNAIRKLIVR